MEPNAIQSRTEIPITPEQTQTQIQARTRTQQQEQNQQENGTPPATQEDSSDLSSTGVALSSRTSANPPENNNSELNTPEQARDRAQQTAQAIENNPKLAITAQGTLESAPVGSLLI